MPPARRALLLAVTALLLLAAAPAAVAAPFTHVLTGGRITSSGSGSGSWNQDAEHFKRTESIAVNWHTEWIKSGIYENYGNVALLDGAWVEDEADVWQENVASGNSYQRQEWYDPSEDKWEWDDPVTCSIAAVDQRPGGIPPRLDEAGHPLIVTPLGGGNWVEKSSCSSGDKTDAFNWVGSDIMAETRRNFAMGTKPYDKAKHTQEFSFQHSGCPDFISDRPCTETYSGGGTMTLECVLCVTEMKLEQRNQPDGGLVEVPAKGTTDGNTVWVTAKVQNRSKYSFESMIQWRERVSKRVLLEPMTGNAPVRFPANSTTTVVLQWDTSGFAWEDGHPKSDRKIELITPLGGAVTDVKVLPKPVIMVHGWKADASGWADGKQLLKSIHPELADRGYAVGDDRAIGVMNTDPQSGSSIAVNAAQVRTYVEDVRADLDAEHVEFLVHSMGGLISRWYIQELMPQSKDWHPVVSHLLMLGTPNMGSPCADLMAAIGVDGIPTQQLRPGFVDGVMNKKILQRRNVPFAVMAGDWEERTCQSPRHGDLVVEVESAWWTIEDVTKTYAHHVELTDIPAIYTSWVKPRMALDPDAAGNPGQYDPASLGNLRAADAPVARRAEEPESPAAQVAERKKVDVPAGGSAEIALDVTDGDALVGIAMAPEGVASSLVAPDGTVVDAIAAGSPAAAQQVRFHRAESPAHGTWKLRLSQPGGSEAVPVTAGLAVEGSALKLEATAVRSDDAAPVALRAAFRDGAAGVGGAAVEAVLRADGEAARTVVLEESGSGVYRATEALPAGEWFGVVSAASGGRKRAVPVMVTIGAAAGEDPGGHPSDPSGPSDPTDPFVPADSSKPSDPSGADGSAGGSGPGGASRPGVSAPVLGGGEGSTPPSARRSPRALKVTVKQRRDRRKPYAFAVIARLSLPAGLPAGACRGGQVALALQRGGRPVASKRATLSATCTFRTTIATRRPGRLTLRAAFLGSRELTALSARAVRVRAG
ncbi:MAG TPA: hypothetical protein VF529_10320 [Solirubrobacteraceae bacterium]|jgi:hypothetical protein